MAEQAKTASQTVPSNEDVDLKICIF